MAGVLDAMSKTPDWTSLAFDSWRLAWEASTVIGMRLAQFSLPHASNPAEAQRMVAEKIQAAAEIQMKALTGALGATPHAAARKTVAHYRKKVNSNRRRLSKPRK